MTVENIENRIDEINKRIKDIEGRPTEVYSRIVGYYRSVKNWNNGKSAEYKVRKTFMEPDIQPCQPPVLNVPVADEQEAAVREEAAAVETVAVMEEQMESSDQADLFSVEEAPLSSEGDVGTYSFFFRTTCPNCPPMKDLIAELDWKGNHINVDEEEGLNAAVEHNVFTAPTVILFSPEGSEIFRTDNVAGLREFVETGAGAVPAV